jgi:hypothetical protein
VQGDSTGEHLTRERVWQPRNPHARRVRVAVLARVGHPAVASPPAAGPPAAALRAEGLPGVSPLASRPGSPAANPPSAPVVAMVQRPRAAWKPRCAGARRARCAPVPVEEAVGSRAGNRQSPSVSRKPGRRAQKFRGVPGVAKNPPGEAARPAVAPPRAESHLAQSPHAISVGGSSFAIVGVHHSEFRHVTMEQR